MSEPDDTAARIGATADLGVLATLRQGLRLSPEMARGLWLTLVIALFSTLGKVVMPIAIQQITDTGILAPGGPDMVRIGWQLGLAVAVVLLTTWLSYLANIRLFRATEAGLSTLRVKTFRHIHSMSTLTQNTERRGSLVSRVTSDVDTISLFVQWAGLMLILAVAQLGVATVLMAVYSWQLAILAWLCFLPMILIAGPAQRAVSAAFLAVRTRIATLLGAVSETVVGAETIRTHHAQQRAEERLDEAVTGHRKAMVRAQNRVSFAFSGGVAVSWLTAAAVVIGGIFLGREGLISVGALLAVLFLVQLFTGPVVVVTETLTELQNAVAGWRRVIAVLQTPVDVPDPGENGTRLPDGPLTIAFSDVSFAYPEGPTVLDSVSLTIPGGTRVAVVGETGSGKTTLARLLTRLMDPNEGAVTIGGVDVRDVPFTSLRSRVAFVPQDGFLFDASLADNIAFAAPHRAGADVDRAIADLGLSSWIDGLPLGLRTQVGQRGESLSAGERQLVAIIRAYLVAPDLLVLDEATSAVDPAAEVRIQRALERLTAGRTSVAIAHRLSTAETADLVLVMDQGRLVESGSHRELLALGGRYARMHASWIAQTR